MNGKELGNELKGAIDGIADKGNHALLWEAVGEAIVSYIKVNAVVQAGIKVETTGSAAAQSGTTTEVGKIE